MKQYELPATQAAPEEEGIKVLDVLIVLAKHKNAMLGLPSLVALIVACITLLMPNYYTGITKILPPQQSQSAASAMLAQLGNVASLVGTAAGIKNPSDLYVGMLRSRSIADNLIQRFNLLKVYNVQYGSQARKELDRNTTISAGKEGIITVQVDDKDPKRAADIANAYVDELTKLTSILAVTEASQRRLFFEHQLAQARGNLDKAEISARQGLATGLVKVDDQGKAMIETTARLRAQITAKEVQIGAMRTFAADRNADLRLAQQELESMKHQLATMEGSIGTQAPAAGAAGQGIENLRLLRDVKYQETMVELLAKQYEIAKIDEAKDSGIIQIMDRAIQPDTKSKPARTLIVLLAAVAAVFFAMLWAFLREAMERAHEDPQQAARLNIFASYLTWRNIR